MTVAAVHDFGTVADPAALRRLIVVAELRDATGLRSRACVPFVRDKYLELRDSEVTLRTFVRRGDWEA